MSQSDGQARCSGIRKVDCGINKQCGALILSEMIEIVTFKLYLIINDC